MWDFIALLELQQHSVAAVSDLSEQVLPISLLFLPANNWKSIASRPFLWITLIVLSVTAGLGAAFVCLCLGTRWAILSQIFDFFEAF